jgi:hypothetical protein
MNIGITVELMKQSLRFQMNKELENLHSFQEDCLMKVKNQPTKIYIKNWDLM